MTLLYYFVIAAVNITVSPYAIIALLLAIVCTSCYYSYKYGSVQTKVDANLEIINDQIERKVDYTVYRIEIEDIRAQLKENKQDHKEMISKLDKILETMRNCKNADFGGK